MKIGIPPEPQREIAPAGSHYGVCCTVCDLGTQKSPYGVKRQLYLAWETPEEKTSKGKPHVLGKFYNLTGNERGTLRQDLESWYGKHFSKEEIAELDLIEALLGRTATIGVMHAAPQRRKTAGADHQRDAATARQAGQDYADDRADSFWLRGGFRPARLRSVAGVAQVDHLPEPGISAAFQ